MKSIVFAAGLLGLATSSQAAEPARPAQPPGVERPRLDADGDGKVTWAEFEKRALDRFDRLAVHGDGRVSKAEWIAGRHQGRPGPGMRPPGPGMASPGMAGPGMRMWRHRQGGMGMRQMGFERIDLNDDGFVSRDEADRAAKRLFAFLDLNGDGVLSGKELPRPRMGRWQGGPPVRGPM